MSKPGEPIDNFTSTRELAPNEQGVDNTLGPLRRILGSQSAVLFLVLVILAMFFSVLRP